MATTYTENLHLELQEDDSDYIDWDAIQRNWKKIDEAYGELLAAVNGSNENSD